MPVLSRLQDAPFFFGSSTYLLGLGRTKDKKKPFMTIPVYVANTAICNHKNADDAVDRILGTSQ
jgi:hypothetical protein